MKSAKTLANDARKLSEQAKTLDPTEIMFCDALLALRREIRYRGNDVAKTMPKDQQEAIIDLHYVIANDVSIIWNIIWDTSNCMNKERLALMLDMLAARIERRLA